MDLNEQQAKDSQTKDTSVQIWKKWITSKGGSGRFCSVHLWPTANKIIVDMGTSDASGKLDNNTKLYVDSIELYTYLEAVKLGTAKTLYPNDTAKDKTYHDVFTYYGGGKVDGKPVSRILKIQTDDETRTKYLWKNGIFVARDSNTGAFIPDYNQQISVSSIQVTRLEMAIICNTLLLNDRLMIDSTNKII